MDFLNDMLAQIQQDWRQLGPFLVVVILGIAAAVLTAVWLDRGRPVLPAETESDVTLMEVIRN